MRIVVDINHPAHVHYFKNFIWDMERKGHEILITASEKDISLKLLNNYGFKYIKMGAYGNTLGRKLISLASMDLKMCKILADFKPHIVTGFGSVRAAHASKLCRVKCIIFDDDEYTFNYYYPFTQTVIGFSGFKMRGKKVIKLNSFKELAYLHPSYFKANSETLAEVGISKEETFSLLRLVGWTAHHDFGRKGFSPDYKRKLISAMNKHCKIFISSEVALSPELKEHQLKIPPEKIHDLLYFAKLLVSDSQTMTTEAAILGTPAIRCNDFVGPYDMGNFVELEKKYELIYNYNSPYQAIEKAIELLRDPNLKIKWEQRKGLLLRDKINITAFMSWFIENYPESFEIMKENPKYQDRFR